jgi:hypothetical protein
VVPATAAQSEYCAVKGYIQPQIQFEIRLPTKTWNGRYFQVGCGGFCGQINIQNCGDMLAKDFAVAADNMGHVGDFLKDPVWGSDPALRADFGRRSTHVTAVVAKAVVERFYGGAPAYSYFRGCSTGGREGLSEAQHYPADFNGIVAGDPAFAGRLGAISNTWDAQNLSRPDGTLIMGPAKRLVLHKAVLAQCDGLDGLKDGIIMDPRACHFDSKSLQCKSDDGPSCLTSEEVAASLKTYAGAHDSQGTRLYPGGAEFGSELAWENVNPLAEGAQRFTVFTPNRGPDYTYRQFDFDKDVEAAKASSALYDPVAPGEAPDLTAFQAMGGKLIVYHGWADPGVSPLGTLDYYANVSKRQGGLAKTRGWFRVFMVPGMFHCRGGDAPNTFDFMPSIIGWVEGGALPDAVVAAQKADGKVVRTRPLFAYPEYARYSGKGNPNLAASWIPATPSKTSNDAIDWAWGPR